MSAPDFKLSTNAAIIQTAFDSIDRHIRQSNNTGDLLHRLIEMTAKTYGNTLELSKTKPADTVVASMAVNLTPCLETLRLLPAIYRDVDTFSGRRARLLLMLHPLRERFITIARKKDALRGGNG